VNSLFRRRPSPAMIIALIALFVSLSGVSYGVATGYIDSREIKNNQVRSIDIRNNEIRTRDLRNNQVRGIDIRNSSVQGRDIALNTVTGNDVNEATLGKVPSAGSADTAGSAGSAGTAHSVGGVTLRRIAFAGEQAGPLVEILNLGGLTLRARCTGTENIEILATTSVPNSEISADFPLGTGDNLDFDPGELFQVIDSLANENGLIGYAASNGTVVTVTGVTRSDANDVRGTTADCGFFGVASAG